MDRPPNDEKYAPTVKISGAGVADGAIKAPDIYGASQFKCNYRTLRGLETTQNYRLQLFLLPSFVLFPGES
jgi:hypothetical protein